MVLSHAPGGWRAARNFEELFSPDPGTFEFVQSFVPKFGYVVDDLSQVDDAALLDREQPAEATLALWVLRDGRLGASALDRVEHFAPLLEQLAAAADGSDALGRFILYLSLAAGEAAPDVETIAETLGRAGPAAREAAMNNLDKFGEKYLKQGRQEGRQEGRREGILEGERRLLRSQIEHRFGPLDDDQLAKVTALSGTALEQAAARVLTADSIDAVLG